VYQRPFVTVWTALGAGARWEDAVAQGMARATSAAAMDVQLAFRASADEIGRADDGIYGFQRVADGGACAFCLEVDGAYVKTADASPLHNHCGCGLEPLTDPHPGAAYLPSPGRLSVTATRSMSTASSGRSLPRRARTSLPRRSRCTEPAPNGATDP
jgi:hypothetical protein